jgi:hypothetical protein
MVKDDEEGLMSRIAYLSLFASLTLFAAPTFFAFSPTDALALSSSASECTAAGGTYTKDGPNSICVFPEVKVSSPNANPDNNAQTTQKTTTGHGNLDNKPVEQCTGNPGHCK